jgi:hypothetical protein
VRVGLRDLQNGVARATPPASVSTTNLLRFIRSRYG